MSNIFFINENYHHFPDLIVEVDKLGHILSKGIHLSIDRPIKYKSMTSTSYMSKDLYDLESLIVSPEIANIFQYEEPNQMHLTPISIKFSNGKSKNYYRLDTSLEHDLIDYNKSTPIFGNKEDGFYFEKIVLDEKKLDSISHPSDKKFFKLKGLQTVQYMINDSIRESIVNLKSSALISDQESYAGL